MSPEYDFPISRIWTTILYSFLTLGIQFSVIIIIANLQLVAFTNKKGNYAIGYLKGIFFRYKPNVTDHPADILQTSSKKIQKLLPLFQLTTEQICFLNWFSIEISILSNVIPNKG